MILYGAPYGSGVDMEIVILTALGVGGATVFGAIIGFIFKDVSHKFTDIVLGFAAGIMLCAAMSGLILPAIEFASQSIGGWLAIFTVICGLLSGAVVLTLIDRLSPRFCLPCEEKASPSATADSRERVMLFVTAIAIHNLPEGIATGVGFGTENVGAAFTIALGIALQNIPEGMVIISPMLCSGASKRKTLVIAVLTGVIEIVGTFIGYFAVNLSRTILPFALAFAGGTMLYVICEEMIPETHESERGRRATYALLLGFCLMLAVNYFLS